MCFTFFLQQKKRFKIGNDHEKCLEDVYFKCYMTCYTLSEPKRNVSVCWKLTPTT